MEKRMFGKRVKKVSTYEKLPGQPYNNMDQEYENEPYGKEKDNPPRYEGRENTKYKNPGYTREDIRYPKDEPHMKSRSTRHEAHEMEDNFHMGIPDQTPKGLPSKIKRAHMKMDEHEEIEEPAKLRGQIVHSVPYSGEEDTTGEERDGSNYMQSSGPKGHRKKMAVAIARRKMKREKE